MTPLTQAKMEVDVPILDRVEGRATMQRRAVHGPLKKGSPTPTLLYRASSWV